jgi:hypothetical protein
MCRVRWQLLIYGLALAHPDGRHHDPLPFVMNATIGNAQHSLDLYRDLGTKWTECAARQTPNCDDSVSLVTRVDSVYRLFAYSGRRKGAAAVAHAVSIHYLKQALPLPCLLRMMPFRGYWNQRISGSDNLGTKYSSSLSS